MLPTSLPRFIICLIHSSFNHSFIHITGGVLRQELRAQKQQCAVQDTLQCGLLLPAPTTGWGERAVPRGGPGGQEPQTAADHRHTVQAVHERPHEKSADEKSKLHQVTCFYFS